MQEHPAQRCLKRLLPSLALADFQFLTSQCKSLAIAHVLGRAEAKQSQRFHRRSVGQRSQSLQQPPMEWALPVKEKA
jgi:hypothetical protein